MSAHANITVDIHDHIGVIKFNRPDPGTSWTDSLLTDLLTAFRKLDEHPRTVSTVVASEGPFRSIVDVTTDVIEKIDADTNTPTVKVIYMRKFAKELLHSIINHKKNLALALDGPLVWGGPLWVEGVLDILAAATTAYLGIPDFDSSSPLESLKENIARLSAEQGDQAGPDVSGGPGRKELAVGERLSAALNAVHGSAEPLLDRRVLEGLIKTIRRNGMVKSTL
ncbi:hypothetical protein HFD88_006213 [Aspergillus terreus]|nr:hypothetical protein HFD88_006213 [Aspergillus terreus]